MKRVLLSGVAAVAIIFGSNLSAQAHNGHHSGHGSHHGHVSHNHHNHGHHYGYGHYAPIYYQVKRPYVPIYAPPCYTPPCYTPPCFTPPCQTYTVPAPPCYQSCQ